MTKNWSVWELDTASMDEKYLFDAKEEINDDKECNSNGDSLTDSYTDMDVDIHSSNESDFYVGRGKITTNKKEKFWTIVCFRKIYNIETFCKNSYFKRWYIATIWGTSDV